MGELKSLMQQSWVMMLEFYKKLEKERKEQSLPGSVPPVEGQLFGNEELQVLRQLALEQLLVLLTRPRPQPIAGQCEPRRNRDSLGQPDLLRVRLVRPPPRLAVQPSSNLKRLFGLRHLTGCSGGDALCHLTAAAAALLGGGPPSESRTFRAPGSRPPPPRWCGAWSAGSSLEVGAPFHCASLSCCFKSFQNGR